MDPETVAKIVWAGIGLCGTVFVIQFIIIPTVVDTFREKLFSLRRDLFLYMADGHIAPDHAAYVRVRTFINGLLRFAERLTFLRVVLIIALNKPEFAGPDFDDLLSTIKDDSVRQRMLEFHLEVQVAIIQHISLSSPVAWVLTPPILIAVLIKGGVHNIRRYLRKLPNKVRAQMRSIESEAEVLACAA